MATKKRTSGATVNTSVQGLVTGRIVETTDLHPYIVARFQNYSARDWAREHQIQQEQFITNYAPAGVNWKARRTQVRNVKPDAVTQANAHPQGANYMARPYACQNAGMLADTEIEGIYQ